MEVHDIPVVAEGGCVLKRWINRYVHFRVFFEQSPLKPSENHAAWIAGRRSEHGDLALDIAQRLQ